ncbi:putative monooxygenase p33MONOX isoform X2 [Leuresthes tenuis]|uniref:putative monooxygenase p33MONOX isoform X2 n=1 Tax=Leuresthes tenuis TaxID=355514 RepID=UPI003B5148A5
MTGGFLLNCFSHIVGFCTKKGTGFPTNSADRAVKRSWQNAEQHLGKQITQQALCITSISIVAKRRCYRNLPSAFVQRTDPRAPNEIRPSAVHTHTAFGFSAIILTETTNYGKNEGVYRAETPEKTYHKKKLRMPSGDFKEDRLSTSAQSTPCGTPSVTPSVTPCVSPLSSPAVNRRNWYQLSPTQFQAHLEPNKLSPSIDMGGNEGGSGGGGLDRWSFFGTRSVVHKSPTDPGSETSTGFSIQSYFGLQKSSTVDGTNSQISLKVEDPAKFLPPKIDISSNEAKQASARPHKLKPRDMNVLTPSGF